MNIEDLSAHILVVEDEAKLASLVMDYLAAAGYVSTWIANGTQALEALRTQSYDLLLLDLRLPGTDGLQICRAVRQVSDMPVLMTTARVEEIDRLIGLEAGADDYVCKPYSPRELVARVKAVLRRSRHTQLPARPVQIDPEAFTARYHGATLDLTRAEFRLLEVFSLSPGRAFTRTQLLDLLYDDGRAVTDRTVDSHIRNLRRKLQAVQGDDPIRSIYGVGYRWEA